MSAAPSIAPVAPPPMVHPEAKPALDRVLAAQGEIGLLERSIASAKDPTQNDAAAAARLRSALAKMQAEAAAWATDPDIQRAAALQAQKADLAAKIKALGGSVP